MTGSVEGMFHVKHQGLPGEPSDFPDCHVNPPTSLPRGVSNPSSPSGGVWIGLEWPALRAQMAPLK